MMSSSDQPVALSRQASFGVETGFVVWSALFVVPRVVVNVHKTKKLLIEDAVSIFALVLLMAALTLNCEVAEAIFTPTPALFLVRVITAFNFLIGFAMWSSKVPILLLYVRLFGITTNWLRIAAYTTIAVTLALFLAGMSYVGASCVPYTADPSAEFVNTCKDRINVGSLALGFVAISTDIIILVLPIPVLMSLSIPQHKKVGLMFVFLSGIVALAAGITSLFYKWQSTSGGTIMQMRVAMLCRVVESCIAIVAGSVPALYAFWKTFIAPSALYSRARSCLSSIAKRIPSLRGSQTGPRLPLTKDDSSQEQNGRGGISQSHVR
ncbi:hypothetical protein B0H63DRAFT_102977 [Podospora didyma]|uniref:Rhodopsin domain-containing protein n=1 Tax=Podospora didyma TaxID=330526 RepID=A0AAE0U3W8_9PEZI|nr:hypothetical protein B0H63DRAFT_102977 [Podospora didyma]